MFTKTALFAVLSLAGGFAFAGCESYRDEPPATTARVGPGTLAHSVPDANTGGTSATASGHGTPTDTGANTENAGTGGTDDPRR